MKLKIQARFGEEVQIGDFVASLPFGSNKQIYIARIESRIEADCYQRMAGCSWAWAAREFRLPLAAWNEVSEISVRPWSIPPTQIVERNNKLQSPYMHWYKSSFEEILLHKEESIRELGKRLFEQREKWLPPLDSNQDSSLQRGVSYR